jgi:hypothetical protein
MSNPGIDYGMGRSNVDHATGIRYGVGAVLFGRDWGIDRGVIPLVL